MCTVIILVVTLPCMDSSLFSQSWQKFVIDSNMIAPVEPRAADMDSDGDVDIIICDWKKHSVFWYENTGDNVTWTRHTIDNQLPSCMSVGIADFNADRKLDIAVTSWVNTGKEQVVLYQNNLPAGTWLRDIIDTEANGSMWLDVGDIDKDGDIDIVASASNDSAVGIIYWHENAGGTPVSWSRRLVCKKVQEGHLALADIDNDDTLDVVAALAKIGSIVWMEPRQRATEWQQHEIARNLAGVRPISVGDVNYDGKTDVVGRSHDDSSVVIYKQLRNGQYISWQKMHIGKLPPKGFAGIVEVDGDSARDVVVMSSKDNLAVWYRNDGTNRDWARYTIDNKFIGARKFCTVDLDGDGDQDIVACAQQAANSSDPGSLVWYRNDFTVPYLSVSPTVLDFGKVMVNSTVTMTLEITNSGTSTLDIDTLTIPGSPSAPFRIDDANPCKLPPGESIFRDIICAPVQAGSSKEILHISTSDPESPWVDISMLVDGVTDSIPYPSIRPMVLDFGNVKIGCTEDRSLAITNNGTGVLLVDTLQVQGSPSTPFSIIASEAFSLTPRENTNRIVSCTPTYEGTKVDTLRIHSNAQGSPVIDVKLIVNGITGLYPQVSVYPTVLNFGNVPLETTMRLPLKIINRGTGPLMVNAIEIRGTSPAPFSIDDPAATSIAAGDTVTRWISCMPIAVGIKTKPLRISSNDPEKPDMHVNLIVNGVRDPDPHVRIKTPTIDFGSMPVFSSTVRTLEITNIGGSPLAVDSMRILGSGTRVYTLGDACSFTVQPGDTACRAIHCTPTIEGISQRQLHIECNDPDCHDVYVMLIVDGNRTDIADVPVSPTLRMDQNFPNPFNQSTEIEYSIPVDGHVMLIIFDLLGREVDRLVDGIKTAGIHHIPFNGANLPSGVYICRIEWNEQIIVRRMTLIK